MEWFLLRDGMVFKKGWNGFLKQMEWFFKRDGMVFKKSLNGF